MSATIANSEKQGSVAVTPESPVLVEKVVELVKCLCVAFSNLSVYPATHKIVVEGANAAYSHLQGILKEQGKILISFAGGKLLFSGLPLEEKNPSVRKFAKHLESLKVHSLAFTQGMEQAEFAKFLQVFHLEASTIENEGGLKTLLDQIGVTHIETNTAVYRLISEDEMIVQKGAHVDQPSRTTPRDKEVVEYLVQEVLARREGNKDFMDELKNNPAQIADQIVTVVDRFGADESLDQESLAQAVLHNIEMVGQHIAQQQPGEGGAAKDIAASLHSLEYELKRKSGSLGSKASLQFLKRITEVVSSYSMRAKASVVLNEFLENERSLKSVEAMLKELTPDAAAGKRLLEQLRRVMKDRNMAADDLIQYLESDVAEKTRPKKTSKTFRPLADRLKAKLAESSYKLPAVAQEELLNYLDGVFCREIKQAVREATEPLERDLAQEKFLATKTARALQATGIGVILLDASGTVRHVEFQGTHVEGVEVGKPFPAALEKAILETAEGSTLRYGNISIFGTIRDEAGKLDTVLFQPVRVESMAA